MSWIKMAVATALVWSIFSTKAYAVEAAKAAPAVKAAAPAAPAPVAAQAPAAAQAPVAPGAAAPAPQYATLAPYRTWITLDNFEMISNGDAANPISNVKIEVLFPGGKKFELPEGGQYWTIGNGQKQDIKRTYELPWSAIQNDGFAFTIQMVRKGSKMLPCNFKVDQLSQFNRTYFCHTDLQWQMSNKFPEEKLDKEGILIRVWTDKNTPAKDQPKDALALR